MKYCVPVKFVLLKLFDFVKGILFDFTNACKGDDFVNGGSSGGEVAAEVGIET